MRAPAGAHASRLAAPAGPADQLGAVCPPPGVPPLELLFDQPGPDMPDWLRDDSAEPTDDLLSIFAAVESDELSVERLVVDANDPWVEASST